MQHVKRPHLPIVYDESTYWRAGAADLREVQAPRGYRAGMVLALHLPDGRHLVLGVDRDQNVPENSGDRLRLLSILQLAAACTLEPAIRYLSGGPAATKAPQLTAREQEVWRWVRTQRISTSAMPCTSLSAGAGTWQPATRCRWA